MGHKPTRRDFLKLAAAGAAGAAGAPWIARTALAKPATLTFLRESSYVKAFDDHFLHVLAPAYEKETGIKVNYETASAGGSVVQRLMAIAETKSAVDVAWVFPESIFRGAMLDVSDLAEAIGKEQGGWYDEAKRLAALGGSWKYIPFGNIGQVMVWRRDWFEQAGIHAFPDTWDEFLEAGTKLKANGHPFGMTMGHGFADNNAWQLPLLWSHGARVVEADGKTLALDSAETARCVDYVRTLYKQACIEDCVGWLDPSNNKAFLTSQISCTNNAASILISAKQDLPEMGKVIEHSLNPKGPKGRFHLLIPVTHGIFSHTPDPQAAKDFLHWVMQPKQLAGWYAAANMYYAPFLHAYDHSPEWNKEPRFKPIQQVLETGRLGGWPAPPDRNLAQVGARWIVSDMFAKACLGASTRTVIAEAMAGLKQIYGET